MSSWSEAVWVVKKLQKNFDFTSEITYYTQNLNTLNGRVNALNSKIADDQALITTLQNKLDEEKESIKDMSSTIVAINTNGVPNGDSSKVYSKGTIWLIDKGG